jgi:peptidoglycan/xylan/chitin deacetylase (PgdA/CDA1 family)
MLKSRWYILSYHNISWQETFVSRALGGICPPDLFESQIETLQGLGDFVLPDEAIERLKESALDRPLFSIWFDDGLRDVRRYALPILKQKSIKATMALCSAFMKREHFFWRYQLSALAYRPEKNILKDQLKPWGYEEGLSVKEFTLNHFSLDMFRMINELYEKVFTKEEKERAWLLFDTVEGMKDLKNEGWLLTNHSRLHYPIGESACLEDLFCSEFESCDRFLEESLSIKNSYWVLPFDRMLQRASQLEVYFKEHAPKDKYLVLLRERVCSLEDVQRRILSRISVPLLRGKELLRYLNLRSCPPSLFAKLRGKGV